MPYFVPEEESLDRDGLGALQRRKLGDMLRTLLARNPFYRRKYSGLSAEKALASFDQLPLTTRAEIQQDQSNHPPYGTNLTWPISAYCRLHQTSATSGEPLRVLDRAEDWTWWRRCWGIIYRAAGVTAQDRFIFPFSFGPFIGFWAAFESAVGMGHLCLPAGGMTTSARLRFMLDNGATVVCCTPTYALRMAEVAAEEGVDLARSAVRLLIVAGEPGGSIPATRAAIELAWGARVIDHTGASEVGPHGVECVESPGGVHFIESEFIAEVIDPQSGRPVADGSPGELVMTNLGRWGMPLVRYRTGDMVCVTRDKCGCGRHFARAAGGILGRIDDMFFVRGNNVYPAQIEGIVREIEGLAEYRIHVRRRGAMSELSLEIEPDASAACADLTCRVEKAIQDRLHFRPAVRLVEPGTLPRFEMKAKRVVRSD